MISDNVLVSNECGKAGTEDTLGATTVFLGQKFNLLKYFENHCNY